MPRTTQGQLEGRKATPLLLHESGIHADRCTKLTGGVGKAMHNRTESEVARHVDVTGLDPTAGGGDETVCRDRLGPQLLIWTIPEREPACDYTALLRCQRRGRQLPVLLQPGHDLAIGRIDKTMAQA